MDGREEELRSDSGLHENGADDLSQLNAPSPSEENSPLENLTFSYQSGNKRPESPDRGNTENDYNYYRLPSEVQPGWQKRLAIALAGLTAVIAPLVYLDHQQRKESANSGEGASAELEPASPTAQVDPAQVSSIPEEEPAEENLVPELQLPQGNILHTVEQAVTLLEQNQLSGEVVEIVEANTFSYLFVSSDQPATRALILRGIQPEQREDIFKELSAAGANINARLNTNTGKVTEPESTSSIDTGTVLTGVIAFALIAHLVYSIGRNRKQSALMGGQANSMAALGKSGGEKVDQPDTTLDDVGGLGSQVEELREMVDDIKAVIHGDQNIDLPKGVLLMGSPGTGKTLIARAIAGEAGVPVITFDCSQFTAMLKGTGPASVHDGFDIGRKEREALRIELEKAAVEAGEAADKDGACILFFDEFDSIGEERAGAEGALGDDERKNTVNALLQEFDGVNESKNRNIIVIAATNFGSQIDKALVRPGRFTKKIRINPPRSPEQRLDILEKLSRKEIFEKGYSFLTDSALADLAQITPGQTGDDLKAILRGAKDLARRDGGRFELSADDIFESYQRHSFGRILDTPMSQEYMELVNWHEDGHALSAIGAGVDIFIRSAKPRGESGGRVVMDPKGFGEILTSKEDMLKRIFIAAGGRAAEIERKGLLGVTGGAYGDFKQMRSLIAQMLSDGMIEDHYALQPTEMRQEHLTEKQREICNAIFKSAIAYARKGLQAVGNEKIGTLVNDALALDRELVGKEAMQFYQEHLSGEDIAALNRICSEFVNDYMGKNLDTSGDLPLEEQDELFPNDFS